jgi:tripeptide aminopeptidase
MSRTQFDQELEERLIRYCRIDTQSDEKSTTSPSTARQLDLLNLLLEELKEIGAQEVRLTDYGAVLATIPATIMRRAPVIGFLAHVDTAPAFNATGVKPLVHRNYDGGEIVLPDDPHAGALTQTVALPGEQDRRRHCNGQRDDAARRRR